MDLGILWTTILDNSGKLCNILELFEIFRNSLHVLTFTLQVSQFSSATFKAFYLSQNIYCSDLQMSLPLMDSASSATLSQPSNSGIFMETLTSMTIFYAAFRTLASYTTSQEFCRKWDIKSHVGLDVANKTISALFATISALSGTYILSTYGGNYYTDSVLTYFMPFSMGYFLYDLGAMCQVYLAKLESEEDKQKVSNF